MKNSFMRITALVLAMLVCLSGIACGDSQPTDKDTDTVTQDTTPEETTSKWLDSLPDKDMEGAEFNILTAAEQWKYFYDAEETGDIVNDAVYTRNKTVEERFNCKINYRIYNGYMAGMSDVKNAITGSVMGGTMDFDLMVGSIVYVFPLIADGVLSDLRTFEQLDFDQPWWFNYLNDEFSVNNSVYFGFGAYGMMNTAESIVTFFNKNVVSDYGIEDLYQTVLDKKWTFDKMNELSELVTHDIDGNKKVDDKDLVGIISTDDFIPFLTLSMGYKFTKREDGKIIMKDPDDRLVSIAEDMKKLYSGDQYFASQTEIDYPTMRNTFVGNHCLFMIHKLEHAGGTELRNFGEYGIIPTPMYDEAQGEYITPVLPEPASIPLVVKDFDNSAIMLEALQSETYRTVFPQYFEQALKVKYSSDEVTGQMLDIINSGKQCDITYGFLFQFAQSYPMYKVGKEDIVSSFAKNLKKWQGILDDFQEKAAENANT